MINLLDYNLQELTTFVESLNEPKFRAKQLYLDILNGKDFSDTTVLPKAFLDKVSVAGAKFQAVKIHKTFTSKDKTIKFLFKLNDNNLIIENTSKHFIKISFNHGFFDVYIDDIYYHDVDKFDIEETIESIINNYILFKDNTAHILSLKEFKKIIKKDPNAQILQF